MALFNTSLLIQAAHLPPTFKGTPDDLFQAMVERMKIVSPTGISFFVTGDTMPASNQGPWLKNGTQWWVWSEELKTYVPLDVSESETKWFQVGSTIPTTATPPVWLRTTANPTEAAPNFGQPVAWYLFNGTEWVDFTSVGNRSITQSKLHWFANFYGVATGTNNYAVTFVPTVAALPFGYGDGINGSFFCIVKFPNANTGPVTLNVNGLSPRPVKKNVNDELVAGDIGAGAVHLLAYDGINFQIQTPVNVPLVPPTPVPDGIIAGSDGLVIQNNAALPTIAVDIIAQRVTLTTPGGATFNTYNVSQTIDITVAGLGGLDTVSTPEAPSTWYYIWLVSDGTNISAVFSTSNTAPELPASYTYVALLGAIFNNSASDLVSIYQTARRTSIVQTSIAAAPTGMQDFSISIPPIAKTVFGSAEPSGGPNIVVFITIAGDSTLIGGITGRVSITAGNTTELWGYWEVSIITPQQVYAAFVSTTNANFLIAGFTI